MNAKTRRRRLWQLHRRQDGQAAFEFMLMMPFFVLGLLLVVDFGILMYEYVSVSNAVREGARYGSVNCGDGSCVADDVRNRAVQRSSGVLTLADVSAGWIDRNATSPSNQRGDSVVVKADHDYSFLFFPFSIPVKSCADMRLERTDTTVSPPAGTACE